MATPDRDTKGVLRRFMGTGWPTGIGFSGKKEETGRENPGCFWIGNGRAIKSGGPEIGGQPERRVAVSAMTSHSLVEVSSGTILFATTVSCRELSVFRSAF